MRILKSRIFAFILGGVIFSTIGVFAYAYNAGQITYTPKDTTWKKQDGTNITNVKDAIDELNRKAVNLSSSQISSFSFKSTESVQNFNLGFRPSYIACSADNINFENNFVSVVYDASIDDTIITRHNGTTGDVNIFYTINDNGFSWNIVDGSSWYDRTIYCTAVK